MSESEREIHPASEMATRTPPDGAPPVPPQGSDGATGNGAADPYAHHAFGAEPTAAERAEERQARRAEQTAPPEPPLVVALAPGT